MRILSNSKPGKVPAQVFISISGSELTAFNGTFSSKVAQAGAGGFDIMVGMDT